MKTKANRIRWAKEDASDSLGYLEDQGVDTYSFETLLDAADEYLDFLDDVDGCLDDLKDHLSLAVTALTVALDGIEDDEDIEQAFREIGHALEAGEALRKTIAEVGR